MCCCCCLLLLVARRIRKGKERVKLLYTLNSLVEEDPPYPVPLDPGKCIGVELCNRANFLYGLRKYDFEMDGKAMQYIGFHHP